MPDDQDGLREHVELRRRAGAELDEIRGRELRETDTREAIRHLFAGHTLVERAPRLLTSGLVEQQAWFEKLRKKFESEQGG